MWAVRNCERYVRHLSLRASSGPPTLNTCQMILFRPKLEHMKAQPRYRGPFRQFVVGV
jgi:hypothetical protein